MDRAEQVGLGAAIVVHAALFAALYFGLRTPEDAPRREAVAVTLTDEIGLTATATDRPAPAAHRSEDFDTPRPTPQVFQPTPQPQLRPTPSAPTRPQSRPRPTPSAPTRPRSRPTPTPPSPPAPARPRGGSRLTGITSGINSNNNNTGTSSSNAAVSNSDRSNLISRIVRAYRPCYSLGSLSGTAAEDIVVRLRMRPARSGSLASGQVSIEGYRGVDSSNRQYQRQMGEAARSAVLNPRCSFPDLPANMYENGWSDVIINFIPGQLT